MDNSHDSNKPVAWMYDQARYRENDLRGRQWAFNCFSQNKPWVDDMVRNLTPLYTRHQAREPLTLARLCEIEEAITDKNGDVSLVRFARAIEANLKENT